MITPPKGLCYGFTITTITICNHILRRIDVYKLNLGNHVFTIKLKEPPCVL